MFDLAAAEGADQRQVEFADFRVGRRQMVEDAVVRDDLRLAGGAEKDFGFVTGLVHVVGDACLVHHLRFHVGGELAAQGAHQVQQGVATDDGRDFVDQQVGEQLVLPGKQLATACAEQVELLGAAAGGPRFAPQDQPVALQRGQVLADRRAGHRQVAGQLVDAHAARLVEQGAEQVLLGSSHPLKHSATSQGPAAWFRTCPGTA
ncbi:hypothetical protein D9M68_609490 [compost metagenome]